MKKIVTALLLILVLALPACAPAAAPPASPPAAEPAAEPAAGDQPDRKIVVSSKAHTEQYLLGEILALVIENNTVYQVERKIGLNPASDIIHTALLNGEIDLYPEYTGTGWLNILGQEPLADSAVMNERLQEEYGKLGLWWSDLYGFNNTYALTMRREQAEAEGFTQVSDLVGHPELIFGANPDYMERADGYPGLAAAYGLNFAKTFEVDIALKYAALDQEECDVINGFSTDAQLHLPQYAILADDLEYFTAYYAATVCRLAALEEFPELAGALALLDGAISEDEMIGMNYAVEVDQRDYEDVAREFLAGKGLI
ncbi:MAG: glycine/betaine ABC transporter substrate-binding protein [Gracilibacteraceae bacterium]|jgi:glycine betaine/choline ABC-type transport system substrate-binding protein|nr:glycine/betaine ABC transporter substrate-binding protein [Gracilibacteraceae bacterium]